MELKVGVTHSSSYNAASKLTTIAGSGDDAHLPSLIHRERIGDVANFKTIYSTLREGQQFSTAFFDT